MASFPEMQISALLLAVQFEIKEQIKLSTAKTETLNTQTDETEIMTFLKNKKGSNGFSVQGVEVPFVFSVQIILSEELSMTHFQHLVHTNYPGFVIA